MKKVKSWGSVIMSTPVDTTITLGDLKDFLELLTELGVADTAEVLDAHIAYEWQVDKVDRISCAEHHPVEPEKYDFVINAHKCIAREHG